MHFILWRQDKKWNPDASWTNIRFLLTKETKRKSIAQDVKQIWHTAGFKKLLAKRFTNLIYFLEGIFVKCVVCYLEICVML